MTPRTKLIVITTPHNPTGVLADTAALDEIGTIAARAGAHVLVDEVYRDVTGDAATPAAARKEASSSRRTALPSRPGCRVFGAGWIIASPDVTYRVRRARDVVDGTGSIVAERLAALAFQHLDRLHDRARRTHPRAQPARSPTRSLAARTDLEWVPSAGTIVFPRDQGRPETPDRSSSD